ncbi:hypothetical protein ACFYYB_31190 [Streptomyces sp. NPDC002886]|uniref:hypothetical protein n=1 Tax=Streptomyces sp. NPDC002886 TaxID=3364667 RepID=UPI0036BB8DD4
MNNERIRYLAHTVRIALAGDAASPSVQPSRSASLSDTGRDSVVETGSAPWTGEMAAPSFMILVAGPRR